MQVSLTRARNLQLSTWKTATRGNWSAWQDSHLQPFRLERNASALGYTRLVPTAGLAPALLRVLSAPSLPWTTWAKWCRVRDFHPQPLRSERSVSCSWTNAAQMALPAGLSPATATFEASHSDILSYGSETNGRWETGKGRKGERGPPFYAHLLTFPSAHLLETGGSPRIRTEFSPVKSRDFTVKVCNPDGRPQRTATRRRS